MFYQETQSSWLSQLNIEYRCVSIWHRPTNASINYTMIVAQVYRYIHTHIYNMMYIYIYIWLIMCIYTWGPGVRDESELGRELGMKTQRAQRSCAAFSSTWTSGSEAGACMGMLVRWTSRPMYWSGVCWRGQGWGNSGKPTLWPVIGEDYLRHRSGPLEAREEVTQCKTECKDER